MNRKFLEDLGLEKDVIDKVLDENSRDIGKEKQKTEQAAADLTAAKEQLAQRDKDLDELKKTAGDAEAQKKALEDLKAKYDKDTAEFASKIADRDYSDAITAAFQDGKITFTSKGAEKSVRDALMSDRLELKDGKLEGFADRLKKLQESDPDAFASEKPAPRIVSPVGYGPNAPHESNSERLAASLGKTAAESAKASRDIINMYTGRS